MHFNWNKNESAFLVECDLDLYAFKFAVRIQREPATYRLANRLFGFSLLNPKMLRIGPDDSSIDNFVIGIDGVESSFNRTVWSLKNDLAFFVPLDVLKNMLRGLLQPILRSAGLPDLCLLQMHDLFNNGAEKPSAASSPCC